MDTFYTDFKREVNLLFFAIFCFFYFCKGKNGPQTCEKLHNVFGDNALNVHRRWFAKFRSGDFDENNVPMSKPRYTTQQIAEALHIAQSTIQDHLKQLVFVNKLEVCVPH